MKGVISVQWEEMQEQLLETEQLAAWNKIAEVLAHEIRNPLVPIGGFAQRLYRSFPEEDKRKQEALIILKEVKQPEKILNNLLRFSESRKSRRCAKPSHTAGPSGNAEL